jgi:hypothetical protein
MGQHPQALEGVEALQQGQPAAPGQPRGLGAQGGLEQIPQAPDQAIGRVSGQAQ